MTDIDFEKIWEKLEMFVRITPNKKIAILSDKLTGENIVLTTLSAAYVAHKLQKIDVEKLTSEDIWKASGIISNVEKKTLQNAISNLVSKGAVQRDTFDKLSIDEIAFVQFVEAILPTFSQKK